MISVGFLCGSLALFPTFNYPNPESRTHLRLAAAAFLSVTPYTILTLAGTNQKLLALNRATTTGSLSEAEGKRGIELIESWSFWAGWRTVFLAIGWVEIAVGLGKELRLI